MQVVWTVLCIDKLHVNKGTASAYLPLLRHRDRVFQETDPSSHPCPWSLLLLQFLLFSFASISLATLLLKLSRIYLVDRRPDQNGKACHNDVLSMMLTTRTLSLATSLVGIMLSILTLIPNTVEATALTYKIDANERACFYAWVDKVGEKIAFYFAVPPNKHLLSN
jgi:hypothetical protein